MLVAEHRYELPSESNTSRRRNLFTYVACTTLLQQPRQGVGHTLALGNHTSASAWRIVHVEMLVNGCVMLWLKSKSAFTMIPEIDDTKIDVAFRDDVDSAVNRVLDSAFRETAISVVDHCRNAMTVIVSRWIFQQSGDSKILATDLGQLAISMEEKHGKSIVCRACQIVARLHSRGKDNERISKELRSPQEGDAEFAIESVGLVLRDLGWARP